MKTHPFFYILALCTLLFTACKKDAQTKVTKEIFSGYAQKGPLVNGSAITISELNAGLSQTGRTYHATISDNSGSFSLNNIEFASNYVELKADGYYYNEISGATSVGPITLYALSDIGDINSVNVNVLTHLEKQRVEYLIKQQGMSFSSAKKQAQQEVLAIFGFTPSETSFESLNLTADAKLLAASCILQGKLSTGDMMQLMADIIADIRQDGKLENELGWKLLDNVHKLSPSEIRANLTKKYNELGINVTIPDFESYIEYFLHSGIYPPTKPITYPAKGKYGDNILSDEVTEVVRCFINDSIYYSVTADVPKGQTLRIVIERFVSTNFMNNWETLEHDWGGLISLEIIESGKLSDGQIVFMYTPANPHLFEFVTIKYYENGATTPTKERVLKTVNLHQIEI